jgi:hypothetical protein
MQMTTDAIRTEEKNSESVTTSAPETLASIVATVKRDCQQAAKAYLDETKVPHGGE